MTQDLGYARLFLNILFADLIITHGTCRGIRRFIKYLNLKVMQEIFNHLLMKKIVFKKT